MIKRDYTNQFGYVCPTENAAIRNADRKPDPPRKASPTVIREGAIKKMDKHRKAQSMMDFVTAPEKPVKTEAERTEYKQGLKRARALKTTMLTIAGLADYECMMKFALKDKKTGKVYEDGEL